MWPVLVFLSLVCLVIADSWWREKRLQRQRQQAKQEFTARLLQQQEEDFARAQAQQRALFDSMADGVALLDRQGRIQLLNDSLRRLFNLGPAAGEGQPLHEALQVRALDGLALRLTNEKSALSLDLDLRATAGRYLDLSASAVRDRNGEYHGAILVFHDLTRVKQLENTRKEFVANVSHELRTPLSLIKGFVETLLDGAKEDPVLSNRYLKTIQKHTDRLTYLIEDLLSISQLESGQVILNLQPVALTEIVNRVFEDLRAKGEVKQTALLNQISPSLSARADRDRLEQVLFNLVENAIKYGRPQGTVTISAQAGDGFVELRVTDDGPGIPPESQPRIFERFYRVDRARSRETGGTGLGLAIVKHIILAHGGNVWVRSTPGQGASFFFTLPSAPGDEESTSEEEA